MFKSDKSDKFYKFAILFAFLLFTFYFQSCSRNKIVEPDGTIVYTADYAHRAESQRIPVIDWNKVKWEKTVYDDSTWCWENGLIMYYKYEKVPGYPVQKRIEQKHIEIQRAETYRPNHRVSEPPSAP